MLLTCRNISKSFGGVQALDGIDLELHAGEIHGLVGANGAGKSTLMKILSGALPDYEGSLTFEGEPLALSNPHEAIKHGIAMVYQELSGVSQLSVAENIFLGRQIKGKLGLLDWKTMQRRAREILKNVGLDIDVTRRLDHYSLSIRQLIEIARCLDAGSKLFILDEPTSALSPPETRRLFELVRRLRDEGKGIVFISHFIDEVLEVCDRITVLVDGRLRTTKLSSEMEKHTVIHEMLDGIDLSTEEAMESQVTLPPKTDAPPLLEIDGLSKRGYFNGIGFSVSPGEALGLYGFVGAGHQEVAHSVIGSIKADAGEFHWEGKTIPLPSPARAVKMGIAFVAADRNATLVPKAENYKNLTLAHLKTCAGNWLSREKELKVARPLLDKVKCNPPDPLQTTGSLSGGNQQKVVLGKWLLDDIRLLVLDEPTRGMDVGAKKEIMELVHNLKKNGAAVVIASTEPELLLAHCDRILVMRRGKITQELAGCAADEAELMRHA